MQYKKPLFWDYKKTSFLSILLFPFSIIYLGFLWIIKITKTFKTYKKSPIPVLCVGNIYLGGTGKTPLTIKIYEILNKLNYKVATVKKNYSSQKDEQLLLNQKTNLIVSKSRIDAIHHGLSQNLDFLIFDDGLQEMRIEFDVKFVCFKSKYWIGNGLYL